MKKLILLFLLVPILLFSKPQQEKIEYTIGFSQCTAHDAWRKAMLKEVENSLLLQNNVTLIVRDANGSSDTQVAQIKELVDLEIDLLVVSPNESKPLTPIISEIYKKGLPVIVVDRNINTQNYTQYIGADNYQIGFEAGQYAALLLNGEGSVMEIWGLPGSSPAMQRHNGFVAAINEYPEIRITTSTTGEWDYEKSKIAVQPFIKSRTDIDLVFAQNDFMAIGAYEVFANAESSNMPFTLGVDGLYGEQGGIQAVIDKKLAATFLYPMGGEEIVKSALKILSGDSVVKEIILPTVAIDNKNAAAIKAQMNQIVELGERITNARQVLVAQEERYQSQGFRLRLVLFTLLGVCVLIVGGVISYQRLRKQKEEIGRKNAELERLSRMVEEATQAKLRFFTNISHEFRTPISLLLGPLEDLINSGKHSASDQKLFSLMHRNAKRLLRLVNQLMDLRQFDNNKMKLRANRYDLIGFVSEIKESFSTLAEQHKVNFGYETEVKELPLWFDRDKLDKSIFNLLSNAFKFTPDGGSITLKIGQLDFPFEDEMLPAVKIVVKDTGVGMSEEQLANVFNRFYTASGGSQGEYRGSGIGLALTKELVGLHRGQILVESQPGEGTTFTIVLRQGDHHIDKQLHLVADDDYQTPKKQIDITSYKKRFVEEVKRTDIEKPLILIVEDNDDVRSFVKSGLEVDYRIIEAENGQIALSKIENDEPDLVITDVMMPVMDGLELLRHIKSHKETCHIPVVVLSARTSAEQKLQGLSEGADSYIPKPFNSDHLRVRVQKLIEGRKMLRQYYQQSIDIPAQSKDSGITSLDKKFLREARKAIEEHISDSQYGVEDLSKACFISRVHLYRKIKQLTGLSATEFIRHIKLKKAASILIETGKSSSEVAYECGFSSPSYFAKRFKEVFKLSPSEYTAQYKNMN